VQARFGLRVLGFARKISRLTLQFQIVQNANLYSPDTPVIALQTILRAA